MHLPFFFFLCIGKNDLWSREDENIDEEDEIPEKQMTEQTEDKQATKLQDSTVDHKLDEKSIISMFIYNNIIINKLL